MIHTNMEPKKRKVIELGILPEEEMSGCSAIALVEEPAIEVEFLKFKKEEFVHPSAGESHDDFIGRCMSVVTGEGKDQDQAYAICESYWSEKFDIDTSGLEPYVDPGVNKKKIEDIYSAEVLDTIIEMFATLGVSYDDIDFISDKFAQDPKDADYTPLRSIKKSDGVQYLYKYNGSTRSNSRSFCRRMVGLRRMWSREEIDALDTFNEEFGPGVGGGKYSIFKYKGGVNCSHSWQKYEVKRVGQRLQATPVSPSDPIEVQAATALRNQGGNGYVKRPQRNNAPLGGGTDSFSKFIFADEEQKVVVGPAMIPDINILRRDEDGEPYWVKFSEETIKEIAMKYMKEARTNEINQDHIEDKDAGTYVFESWIIEDPETDKAKTVYGYDLPKGTWMCKMKVDNKETWKRIKNGELRGFSVEGIFADMEEIEARRRYEKING